MLSADCFTPAGCTTNVEDDALKDFGQDTAARDAISELTELAPSEPEPDPLKNGNWKATLKPITEEDLKMYNQTQIRAMVEKRLGHVELGYHRDQLDQRLKDWKAKLDAALTKIKERTAEK